jgi:hypothetical protein
MMVSCLPYSSTLKVEEIYSTITYVDFHRTTLRHTPDLIELFLFRTVWQKYYKEGYVW